MKTDELIAHLSAQTARPALSMRQMIALAAVLALAAAGTIVLGLWGPRRDIGPALMTAAFWMKAAYAGALAVAGVLAVERLGRPAGRPVRGALVAAGALGLAFGLAALQLSSLPSGAWMAALAGGSWRWCSLRVAAASGPGFVIALWMLRRMAPTRPRLAGAAAGLMAGGLGAIAYSVSCDETAATFVAIWYTVGMLAWSAVGALVGPRLLRW